MKVKINQSKIAAEQGDMDAQYLLGLCYAHGEGIEKNHTQAAHWYRKAAEQGHSNAQSELGFLYKCGKGVPKDDKEALYWFEKSANQGNPIAKELHSLFTNSVPTPLPDNITRMSDILKKN